MPLFSVRTHQKRSSFVAPALKYIDSAEIILHNGKTLKISTVNQSDENIYVEKVTFNGKELKDIYITHDELINGGELVFTMSDESK